MAVVKRKDKGGTFYGVQNLWCGKQQWEHIGRNKREAEIRDRAMKKEIADGTYQPPPATKSVTFRQEIESWKAVRVTASAADEKRHLDLYVLPRSWLVELPLIDVKPRHFDRLIEELRAENKPNGSRRLSDKTIQNALATVRAVFRKAIREERCLSNPVVLSRETFSAKTRKRTGQEKKEKEIYTAAEVRVLTTHAKIHWSIRVMNALAFYTGMREGEICGRRFRDLASACQLHSLKVHTQYEGRETKTARDRVVPVHPELSAILEAWANEGFELYTGRKPTPDDFIVPNASSRANKPHHTWSSYYNQFVKYCLVVGVRPRSLHSTRHTFVSLCRRAGANKVDLRTITHNPEGDTVDQYTHTDWDPLCRVILSLNLDVLDVHQGVHSIDGTSGNFRSLLSESNGKTSGNTPQMQTESRIRFPAPPLQNSYEISAPEKPRQEIRQESDGAFGSLSDLNARRKRRLLALREASPEAAKPGLAITRALDAAYAGNSAEIEKHLGRAAVALGLTDGSAVSK